MKLMKNKYTSTQQYLFLNSWFEWVLHMSVWMPFLLLFGQKKRVIKQRNSATFWHQRDPVSPHGSSSHHLVLELEPEKHFNNKTSTKLQPHERLTFIFTLNTVGFFHLVCFSAPASNCFLQLSTQSLRKNLLTDFVLHRRTLFIDTITLKRETFSLLSHQSWIFMQNF